MTTTVVDTSVLVAAGDPRDAGHPAARDWLATTRDDLVVPLPVTCEVDHLLARRGAARARRAFVDDLAAGRFQTFCLDMAAWDQLLLLADRYRDLAPGLSDLSLVLAAHVHDTTRVATFDHRHFRVLTAVDGTPFELVPADPH